MKKIQSFLLASLCLGLVFSAYLKEQRVCGADGVCSEDKEDDFPNNSITEKIGEMDKDMFDKIMEKIKDVEDNDKE